MSTFPFCIYPAAIASLCAACTPVPAPSVTGTAANAAPLRGWYFEESTGASLQPCGSSSRLIVVNGGELRKRAADFGLQPGDPVYVRVGGVRTAAEFWLGRVEQFGAPSPVRNCPVTGTVIQ